MAKIELSAHTNDRLTPHLSPVSAWAFSLGTSIGWGSLVVTSNTYLAQAGPAGSVAGLLIGAVIMLIMSSNFAYLMDCYPGAGGGYLYCRNIFGYDYGFLTAWFLGLTYFAILWANATSLPLFARYFLGETFEVGKLYTIFDYDVYLGEAILSIVFLVIIACLCIWSQQISARLMTGMVILFAVFITACFFGAAFRPGVSYSPAFVPDSNVLEQVVKVAIMSPWAFIGFENISHLSEEFTFSRRKSFRILVISVITTTALYVFVTLLSVMAYPERYGSWLEYIQDRGNLSGIEALPAFYAANHYLGSAGVWMLMAALLALILTSLIGNITALSRLLYALGKDGILPRPIGTLNGRGVPAKAILMVAGISILVPFLGRTAIGWIVDVTTFGATLSYGLISAAAFKEAGFREDQTQKRTGLAGVIIMIGFGLYLLIPNLITRSSMEPESYFLFIVWAVLGFFVFRRVLKNDVENRFGRSIIVWIALLSMILFVSMVWMNQSILSVTDTAMKTIEETYAGIDISGAQTEIVDAQMAAIRTVSTRSIMVVLLVFILSLAVLMNNYRLMNKQVEHSQRELGMVRNLAETDPLTGVKSKLAYAETERMLNEDIGKGEAVDFAIAVLDVNGLKHINDTLGHQAGDEYIQKASRMICMYFPHSPVYRTGGDEFVVFLQNHDYDERQEILDMFRKEAEAHIASGDVVVSVGCSDFQRGKDDTMRSVFERADALMYEHKKYLKSMGAVSR